MTIEWCAGFLDGEGSFCIPQSGRLIVSVWQNTRDPLDVLAAELGGRVYGPYTRDPRSHATRKPFYQYHLRSHDLEAALPRLLPHLIVKAAKAELMIQTLQEKQAA